MLVSRWRAADLAQASVREARQLRAAGVNLIAFCAAVGLGIAEHRTGGALDGIVAITANFS